MENEILRYRVGYNPETDRSFLIFYLTDEGSSKAFYNMLSSDKSDVQAKNLIRDSIHDNSIVYMSCAFIPSFTIISIIVLELINYKDKIKGVYLRSFGSRASMGRLSYKDSKEFKKSGLELLNFVCKNIVERFESQFIVVWGVSQSGEEFYTKYGFETVSPYMIYFLNKYDCILATVDFMDHKQLISYTREYMYGLNKITKDDVLEIRAKLEKR